jgi:lipoyl(octanoyl) transferase
VLQVLRDRLAPRFLDYHEGWALQRRVHREVVAGERPGTLILCEHDAVYTAGKRTEPDERPEDGTPVVDVDRGGKITWHGPGQLTGYPIVRLPQPAPGTGAARDGRATGVDVVAFVRDLEGMMIAVAAEFGVTGERVDGRSGVWVRRPGGFDKIGAIGLRVQEGVTMHGFALNCSNALDAYAAIVPCGIRDAGVTTLSEVSGRTVRPADVTDAVVHHFGAVVRVATPAVAA